VAVEHIVMLMW